ncbi:UvrD-helicase domain-containing protein [Streptomyces sp. NPDC085612]|uniref:UvrD-helicase domain-containing protein n=1 Tax=Streptomyces sp. NPDC085612 TaxID=3365732 RepID=UPI0037D3D312
MSSKRGSAPEPSDQQDALFAAEPKARGVPRSQVPPGLGKILNGLISAIARRTGQPYADLNLRLNRQLGVTTRTGAPDEVLQRGITLAEHYLQQLDGARSAAPVPVSRQPSPPASPFRTDSFRATGPAPTAEQELAIEAKKGGGHFVLQAGAGTGKTTTLAMLARADPRKGRFLAFNRPVVDDAKRKFPSNVRCSTGHSLAVGALRDEFGDRLDRSKAREPSWKAGLRLGIGERTSVRLGERLITLKTLSYVTLETLSRFCHSADTEISTWHVPRLRGLADEHRGELARIVLPYARRAWADVQDPAGTLVRFDPNHALKIWGLTRPHIPVTYILLDEAQDTNPVMEEIFLAQRDHAQLIMVGDSAQAIYGWRGARDVMTGFDGQQLTLSQSFRFGPALAEEANRWLEIVESPLRLRGTPTIDTRIGPLTHADAVLCRTNAGAISEIFQLLGQGKRVALVGGSQGLRELARAAGELKAGRRASHYELMLFTSWEELMEYAQDDPAGRDLLPLVEIIEDHGVEKVLAAMDRLHAEDEAEVTVSTAHRAKGREWPAVRIADDFQEPSGERDLEGNVVPGAISLDDARLAYVAVTRARQHLDLGGLAWIDKHPQGQAGSQARTPDRTSSAAPATTSPWDRLNEPLQAPAGTSAGAASDADARS